jgi:hypothetical protein
MDTVGNIIDKLFTVNLKLIHNKDQKRIDNLNIQKIALLNEIDVSINNIISGKVSDIDIVRPQHKTY